MSYNLTNKGLTSDQNYSNSYRGRYETSTSIQKVETGDPVYSCLGTETDSQAGVPQRS